MTTYLFSVLVLLILSMLSITSRKEGDFVKLLDGIIILFFIIWTSIKIWGY